MRVFRPAFYTSAVMLAALVLAGCNMADNDTSADAGKALSRRTRFLPSRTSFHSVSIFSLPNVLNNGHKLA
jgi:predicted small secreted protein